MPSLRLEHILQCTNTSSLWLCMLSLVHEVNNTKQKNKHKANFHYQTTLLKFLYNDMIDLFLTNILIFTPPPWKHQIIFHFPVFSGGSKWGYKMRTLVRNGFNVLLHDAYCIICSFLFVWTQPVSTYFCSTQITPNLGLFGTTIYFYENIKKDNQ